MASYLGVIARRRILLIRSALVLSCLVAALVHSLAVAQLVGEGGVRPALGLRIARDQLGRLVVSEVDAAGPAAGRLQAGDRIVTVNTFPPVGRGLGPVALMDLRDGDHYGIRVFRGDALVDASLVYREQRVASMLWFLQVPLLLIAVSFLVSGAAVGWFRPAERVARLYAALAILVSIALVPFAVFGGDFTHGATRSVFAWARVVSPIMLATGYQFFSVFPSGVPATGAWRWFGMALLAASLLLVPGAAWTAVALSHSASDAVRLLGEQAALLSAQELFGTIFIVTAFAGVAAVIVRNHRVVSDPDQRRRLRWVLWGSLAGTLPMLCAFLWSVGVEAVTGRAIGLEAWQRLQGISALFLIFLPGTFAYAVIQHRVIGIDVVVRKSAQYLLARNVLRVATTLPVVILIVRLVANPNQTLAQLLLDRPLYVVLSVASALALLTRKQLMAWLDRRFFRDAADRDRILLDLAATIADAHDSPDHMVGALRRGIERALHPHSLEICVEADDSGRMLAISPETEDTWSAIQPVPADLLRSLQESGAAVAVEHGDMALLVPIGGGGRRFHGFLRLGHKKSEEPYTDDERRQLKSIADHVAMAWDNAALRNQVASGERQRHQVMARMDPSINLFKECPACGRCYDRSSGACEDDGVPLVHTMAIERSIQGRYRLERMLGRGGMGVVYEATDERLGRAVAVKLMRNVVADATGTRRRFELEARALARLHHPNIVAIHDYGTVGDELAFLVMEHLRGNTLRDALRRDGPMTPAQVAAWAAPVLDAMAFAHAAGVIHRDLKPENVFFSSQGDRMTAKVLDFGLAKLTGNDGPTSAELTEPGAVLGTLAYMSPEQLTGQPVDERSDLFSLGVTVFEALTGVNPFRRADALSTMAALLNDRVRLGASDGSGEGLNDVLQRALAKRPADRPAGIETLRDELLGALAECPQGVFSAVGQR
jgi:GAF domain-containing protein